MEFGSLEREIYVEASPEVAFEVVSSPEHLSEWWSDEASVEVVPGAVGELVWGNRVDVIPLIVVEVEPPRLFSFRWVHAGGDVESTEALLVTFELTPSGAGTKVRMTETGFREMGWGWEVAKLEEQCREHVIGWDYYIPLLGADGGTAMSTAADNDLWSAIGDPMRRRMLDLLLADGAGTATSLGERLPVTRQAVAKHLGVLDRVGLAHGTPAGRERRYQVDEAQLARAVAQLCAVGAEWDARMRRIKRIAEAIQRKRDEQ